MFNKLTKRINNLKERINGRKRPLTDEEIFNYVDSLTKEEKQIYNSYYGREGRQANDELTHDCRITGTQHVWGWSPIR